VIFCIRGLPAPVLLLYRPFFADLDKVLTVRRLKLIQVIRINKLKLLVLGVPVPVKKKAPGHYSGATINYKTELKRNFELKAKRLKRKAFCFGLCAFRF